MLTFQNGPTSYFTPGSENSELLTGSQVQETKLLETIPNMIISTSDEPTQKRSLLPVKLNPFEDSLRSKTLVSNGEFDGIFKIQDEVKTINQVFVSRSDMNQLVQTLIVGPKNHLSEFKSNAQEVLDRYKESRRKTERPPEKEHNYGRRGRSYSKDDSPQSDRDRDRYRHRDN